MTEKIVLIRIIVTPSGMARTNPMSTPDPSWKTRRKVMNPTERRVIRAGEIKTATPRRMSDPGFFRTQNSTIKIVRTAKGTTKMDPK